MGFNPLVRTDSPQKSLKEAGRTVKATVRAKAVQVSLLEKMMEPTQRSERPDPTCSLVLCITCFSWGTLISQVRSPKWWVLPDFIGFGQTPGKQSGATVQYSVRDSKCMKRDQRQIDYCNICNIYIYVYMYPTSLNYRLTLRHNPKKGQVADCNCTHFIPFRTE